MARPRSKQDRDVAGACLPRYACLAIPNVLLLQDPDDFLGRGCRALLGILLGDKPEHWASLICRRIYREAIAVIVGKVIWPRSRLRHLPEEIVDERQEFRQRAETPHDRSPWISSGTKPFDVFPSFLEDGHFRVAKSVDRLLAVADDEDRWFGRKAQPFTPRLDQQRDQLPLRTARILKLIDQHVVITGLQPESALRELVHLTEQG